MPHSALRCIAAAATFDASDWTISNELSYDRITVQSKALKDMEREAPCHWTRIVWWWLCRSGDAWVRAGWRMAWRMAWRVLTCGVVQRARSSLTRWCVTAAALRSRGLAVLRVPRARRPSILGRDGFFVRYGDRERAAVADFDFLDQLSGESSPEATKDCT